MFNTSLNLQVYFYFNFYVDRQDAGVYFCYNQI